MNNPCRRRVEPNGEITLLTDKYAYTSPPDHLFGVAHSAEAAGKDRSRTCVSGHARRGRQDGKWRMSRRKLIAEPLALLLGLTLHHATVHSRPHHWTSVFAHDLPATLHHF